MRPMASVAPTTDTDAAAPVHEHRPLAEDLKELLRAPRELWIVYAMKLLESVAFFTVYTLLVIFLSKDHSMIGGYTSPRARWSSWSAFWRRPRTSFSLSFCASRPPRVAQPKAVQKNPVLIAREVLRERAFWVFMALVALLTFVRLIFQHAHLTWPKFAMREFGEDFAFANYWIINPAMIIVLTPFATAFTRRYRPYPVIAIGAFITSLSVFAMAFSTTVTASVVFIVTLSLGEMLWSPRLYEYTATIAPRGREASYMGLSEVPLFLAKPFVGFLSGHLLTTYCPATGPRDSKHMWLIIGAMTVAAPIIMLVFRKGIEAKQKD
jgi:hypothetical protein